MKEIETEIFYTIVRSGRKTMGIQVKRDGQVIVRCPVWVTDANAHAFAAIHKDWILKQCEKIRERQSRQVTLTEEEKLRYRQQAKIVLQERTAFRASNMGVDYGKITIRDQVTRWGSCNAKGDLSYNWKLILLPAQLLDYVVVHELAHRKEMNHSARFWNIVERELPDYRQLRKRLRRNEDNIDS